MSRFLWPDFAPPSTPYPQRPLPPVPLVVPPARMLGQLPAISEAPQPALVESQSAPCSIGADHSDAEKRRVQVLSELYPSNMWNGNTCWKEYEFPDTMPGQAIPDVSSKRPAPDGDEADQLRPQKAIRTAHELASSSADACRGQDVPRCDNDTHVPRHADDGIFGGKYWCVCDESFSRKSTLRRHLKHHLDPDSHICSDCGMSFPRLDALKRHCEVQHREGKVECPGCHNRFRRDYLTEHFKCPEREECRMVAEALHMDSNGLYVHAKPVTDRIWTSEAADLIHHHLERKKGQENAPDDGSAAQKTQFMVVRDHAARIAGAILHNKYTRIRLTLRVNDEPCAICGMPLESNMEDLVEHINHHSSELAFSKHRCEDCRIDFMFAADLDLHRKAAEKGSCGFEFAHCVEFSHKDLGTYWVRSELHHEGEQSTKCCGGHHPPSNPKVHYDNHQRMHAILSIWENHQLRAHRIAIARLRAISLRPEQSLTQTLRHSCGDQELRCLNLLSRLSVGSISSFRSVPVWLRFRDDTQDDNAVDARSRAESAVLSPDLSTKPPSCRAITPILTFTPARNTYVDHVKATRGPDGVKNRASGTFLRTTTMTRQILAENSMTEVPCEA